MQHPEIQHTLEIFRLVEKHLPPLVPAELAQDLHQGIEQMTFNKEISLEELEHTMITFGKRLWPFTQAFREFFTVYEGKLGEQFLLGKLSPGLKKRFRSYKEHGGTFRDLHTGSPAEFFTPEERGVLCGTLVEVAQDIDRYVRQTICSGERRKYEDRVVEFQVILDDMEKRLDTLRQFAEGEQEHPELAAEIRAQVKQFEEGLCLLSPPPEYQAVCNSFDHFAGRRAEVYKRRKTHA